MAMVGLTLLMHSIMMEQNGQIQILMGLVTMLILMTITMVSQMQMTTSL